MSGPPSDWPIADTGPLYSIGVVRSAIRPGDRMPPDGVPASVVVHPPFAAALEGIESNSHIWLLGWFGNADRKRLSLDGEPRARGVFGVRSASRPNPIGLTPARLLRVDGLRLDLDRLDFFDGTQILDIKRYSPSWDSIHSAMTSRELRPPQDSPEAVGEWVRVAERFRGERSPELVVGVRCLLDALVVLRRGPRDPALVFHAPSAGDAADAIQAITGATIGNGRLRVIDERAIVVLAGGEGRRYVPRRVPATADEASTLPLSEFVAIQPIP